MYNYFYIKNNQNKLLNTNENKYYKIGDTIAGFPITVSGDSSCINILNGFTRNYISNLLLPQPPRQHKPRLILDGLLFSGLVQVYNHDLINVGGSTYKLEEEFLIVYNTDNQSTLLDFRYIKEVA
ncbi:MAG: hypothetical protein LBH40_00770 [Alphaproteobacteria bacterium]|jgi:hypothetical protein|nr:hypothetical protein [Alphaproteobacteria bacterium]